MFGYVNVAKEDITPREYAYYKSCYCGLCDSIGKLFGNIPRIFLSYDMTYLILCVLALDNENETVKIKCPLNPYHTIRCNVSKRILNYAALMNYYLLVLKLKDDVLDKKSHIKGTLCNLLEKNKNYNKLQSEYAIEFEKLNSLYDNFINMENSENTFDEISNAFGNFFAEIFDTYFRANKIEADPLKYVTIRSLCFSMGKFVYIIDAYDDYIKDRKRNEFNLLDTLSFEVDIDNIEFHNRFSAILNLLIININNNLANVHILNKRIIYNISILGCKKVITEVIKKNYPKVYREIFKLQMEQ